MTDCPKIQQMWDVSLFIAIVIGTAQVITKATTLMRTGCATGEQAHINNSPGQVQETELTLNFRKAEDMTATGREFHIRADMTELLGDQGSGVYTVVLRGSRAR